MTTPLNPEPGAASNPPPVRELGFGSRIADNSRARLLNRDGSFNIEREGARQRGALAPYHILLTMSWPSFLGILALYYVAINALFAVVYVSCGDGALEGHIIAGVPHSFGVFLRAYFFSVETFATVGYGNISPSNLAAGVFVTIESFLGLLSAALATGLVFARFSRPTAAIVYSDNAVVAPFQGGNAFMFRCANTRSNQLIEVSVQLLYSWIDTKPGGGRVRRFDTLALEYDRITFFTLSWTVVHPIDERSPLWGIGEAELAARESEFMILLSGVDDTFSTTVHSRTSYKPHEVVWRAKFKPMFVESPVSGTVGMDLTRIHDFERL